MPHQTCLDEREMSHRLSVSKMHMQSPFFVGNLKTLTFAKTNHLKNKTLGFPLSHVIY